MIHGGNVYSRKIKYDFSVNLNPVACPKRVRAGLKKSLKYASRYPDINQRDVRTAIAKLEGVEPDNVLGGNGASELILAVVLKEKPKRVLLTNPCFYGYYHALGALEEVTTVKFSLKEEKGFAIDKEYLEFVKSNKPDMVILTNPNNPTGRLTDESILNELADICKNEDIALLLDECFLKMSQGGKSILPKIKDLKRLYVINAFTKTFSLPGVRAGYVISHKENIADLKKYVSEWNMSVMAQRAAVLCVSELMSTDFAKKSYRVIERERSFLMNSFEDLGIKTYPSDTSYILIYSDTDLYEHLLWEEILIRDCSNFAGLGKGFYRVAVKDHRSNKVLIKTLRKVLER